MEEDGLNAEKWFAYGGINKASKKNGRKNAGSISHVCLLKSSSEENHVSDHVTSTRCLLCISLLSLQSANNSQNNEAKLSGNLTCRQSGTNPDNIQMWGPMLKTEVKPPALKHQVERLAFKPTRLNHSYVRTCEGAACRVISKKGLPQHREDGSRFRQWTEWCGTKTDFNMRQKCWNTSNTFYFKVIQGLFYECISYIG